MGVACASTNPRSTGAMNGYAPPSLKNLLIQYWNPPCSVNCVPKTLYSPKIRKNTPTAIRRNASARELAPFAACASARGAIRQEAISQMASKKQRKQFRRRSGARKKKKEEKRKGDVKPACPHGGQAACRSPLHACINETRTSENLQPSLERCSRTRSLSALPSTVLPCSTALEAFTTAPICLTEFAPVSAMALAMAASISAALAPAGR